MPFVQTSDFISKSGRDIAARNAASPGGKPRTWGMLFTVTNDGTPANNTTWFLKYNQASTNLLDNSNWVTAASEFGGGGGGGTVTSVSFTGGLISVTNPTTTPAFTVAGTSGGIPYFSSNSAWASSALLTAGGIVFGGGAGAAPSTDSNLAWNNTSKYLTVGNSRLFTYGTNNLFLGNGAGNFSLTGIENTLIGTNAGALITSAPRNTIVGYLAGSTISTAFNNTFLGHYAGRLTTGSANTLVGKSAGEITSSGHSNVFVGANAGISNTTGIGTTALGTNAGAASTSSGNLYAGNGAGQYITSADRVVALGSNTFGQSGNTTPTDAIAIGYNSLFGATGVRNIGLGTEVFSQAGGVTDNVGIGSNAADFWASAGGSYSTIIGSQAAAGAISPLETGGNNVVIIGALSGTYNQGANNIILGARSNSTGTVSAVTGTNKILIGSNLTSQSYSASNTLEIQNIIFGQGNSGTGTTISSGTIGIGIIPTTTATLTLRAGTTAIAPLNVPHGVAPTTPVNGDIWTTTTSMYARINGVTVDLGAGGAIGGSTGSVDNALLRADGGGGSTLQSSAVIVSDNNDLTLGTGASGSDRSVIADGSGANISLTFQTKGGGSPFNFNTTSGNSVLVPGGSATAFVIYGVGTTPVITLAASASNSGLVIQSYTASSGDMLISPQAGEYDLFVRGGNPTVGTGGDLILSPGIGTVADGNIILQALPTSSAGLPSGAIWNDSGTLKIA